MKWPLVSRAAYEAAQALALRECQVAGEWMQRYDELSARYHALRERGYAEPPAPVVINRAAPDPVKQAIANAAGTDRALRMQMERQAAVDLAKGVSREEIALRIAAGVTPDETFGVSVPSQAGIPCAD